MKNQMYYFEKVLKTFRDLKKDHPDIELSKHYMLATDNSNYPITDKELHYALVKHKSELDMNTLSDKDLQKVIDETEDLFTEIDSDHIFYEDYDENGDPVM